MNAGVLNQDNAGQRQTYGYIQFLGRRLKAEDAAHIAGTDINSYRHHPRNVTIPVRAHNVVEEWAHFVYAHFNKQLAFGELALHLQSTGEQNTGDQEHRHNDPADDCALIDLELAAKQTEHRFRIQFFDQFTCHIGFQQQRRHLQSILISIAHFTPPFLKSKQGSGEFEDQNVKKSSKKRKEFG